MRSTGNESGAPLQAGGRTEPPVEHAVTFRSEELRLRVQQRSLREQLERHHFLLERLYTASARLIQSLEHGDVFEAITEIIAKLIGSQEIAIFNYYPGKETFALASSRGIEASALQPFESGAGMFGRAVHLGMSQFRERQPIGVLLPYEQNLTACVILKSSAGFVGVIAIFGLLPEKNCLEWADFELLKFLETYAAVAIQFQRLQGKQGF
jgi:GAF domain-containing protein